MILPRSQLLAFESSPNLLAASPWARNLSTQIGVRAPTTASCAAAT